MAYSGEIVTDSSYVWTQYDQPSFDENSLPPTAIPPAGAVTTIEGAVGPVVSFDSDLDGTSFSGGGSVVTLLFTDPDALRTALGIAKQNTATVDPTVNNDDTEGYDVNSIWTNTMTPESFICWDASTGAAVWHSFAA